MYIIITGELIELKSVTFLLESNLNDSNVKFTLSFSTVGGPATYVTWTRNNNSALLLGSTVLVNASTAEYIHTLKVTGRIIGQYNSTAMNNKPSSVSVHLNVIGKLILFSV